MASLYAIGLGPGDPDLVTVKAVNRIREAEILAFICNTGGESMALSIAKPYITQQILLPITIDMSSSTEAKDSCYQEAARSIEQYLIQNQSVAFLCLGDPLLYATFARLLAFLDNHCSIEVIPGITSIQAASASAKLPLALADQSVKIISARCDDQTLLQELSQDQTLAILKSGKQQKRIVECIRKSGRLEESLLFYRLGQREQKVIPLMNWNEQLEDYFTLIIVSPHARRHHH